MQISLWQILLVILLAILMFGAGKLPSIARQVGKSIKEFRKEVEKSDKSSKSGKK